MNITRDTYNKAMEILNQINLKIDYAIEQLELLN